MSSDIEDGFESQDENDDAASSPRKSPQEIARMRELGEWRIRFDALDECDQDRWMSSHIEASEWVTDIHSAQNLFHAVWIEPRPGAKLLVAASAFDVSNDVLAEIGLEPGEPADSPALIAFERYNEAMRKRLGRSTDHHRGYTFEEIMGGDDMQSDLLAGIVPAGQITNAYGFPKSGKSALAQKLGLCIASGLDFDREKVRQGRVLYGSFDPGANRMGVKQRLKAICERLGANPRSNFILVDTPLYLNDRESVKSFLRKNPGEFSLVTIDSLYRAVTPGSRLSDEGVMTAAMDGLQEIIDTTGAAAMVLQHEGRGNDKHPYGSVFQEAALSSLIHIVRDKKTDIVTATVEMMKNGERREAPLKYRLDGPFLESLASPRAVVTNKNAAPAVLADVPHREMLALIPTTAITTREARKLIEHLLSGEGRARDKQWERIRKAWLDAGVTAEDHGAIRRVAS